MDEIWLNDLHVFKGYRFVMFRVLYHAPCPDGATAAMVAAMYFECSGVKPSDSKRVSWHPMKVFLSPEEQFDVSIQILCGQ